uniref:Methyltransferase n=1 Tax=Oryza nivara TaxID=4536 RepID=A0A0E0HFW2_ORYNI
MAVPTSDQRKRRPFLLSLSLFLLVSALLALAFLFLDPSAQSFSVLSSRLTAPTTTLAPPAAPGERNPTPIPAPGDTPPPAVVAGGAEAGESADATEKAEETASRPDDTAAAVNADAAAGEGGGSSESPRLDADKGAAATEGVADDDGGGGGDEPAAKVRWETCRPGRGVSAADYIPCLDNMRAIKALRSRRHMEHRERHCPVAPRSRCLVRVPSGYRSPVPWPRSRDMIWYNNVPHPKLVEYKKDQNWVTKSGDYLVFPGGGTQFKTGVTRYIQFIEQIMPTIQWGTHTKTVLDVGCGVASFGGYLLDRNVITMSFAPKDEHEAQIQFALERGIPAFLAVIGTQKLPFPDEAFDVVHCARCRVENHCWSLTEFSGLEDITFGLQPLSTVKKKEIKMTGMKPASNSCYLERRTNEPPMCSKKDGPRFPWYAPLDTCISSSIEKSSWPLPWPERLNARYLNVPDDSSSTDEKFDVDTKYWKHAISEIYYNDFPVNWSSTRNVMDMNAGYGGFAAALVDKPLWVMNVVPVGQPDTLPVIFNRGLIGVYHDWCESFNTYPRTYDLLHMSYLLGSLTNRCDIMEVAAEIDRILRPDRWFVLRDTTEMIKKMRPVLKSLHYETVVVKQQFLVAKKGFWRPGK